MVKHSVLGSDRFFMRESIGKPQYIAGTLLLVFLAQCFGLVSRNLRNGGFEMRELYRLETGLRLWRGLAPASGNNAYETQAEPGPWSPPRIQENGGIDPDHSELWYRVAAAPVLFWRGNFSSGELGLWGWLTRAPYLVFGVLLGASVWYVARRLYGNAGGFIALTLYCFSPGMIRTTSVWFAEPEIGAAWGAFGAIFTGIAVAHTLYAPREVVLWNWRRIVLLGISIALAVGSQYSLWVLVLFALAFMLYLAPTRRGAAVVIWGAACVLGLLLLFSAYGFRPGAFAEGIRHARWLDVTPRAFTISGALWQLLARVGESSPALILMLPVALVVYLAWTRARYFGNTAPLAVGILCLVLGWAMPHYPGLGFQLVALPFLFVFVAGVFADLLETRHRVLILASVVGLLSAYAMLSLMRLLAAGRG
jgi:hypothetical protein